MHLANNIDLKNGVIGGLLIGASSTAYLILNGKISGMSGFFENVVKYTDGSSLIYLTGLLTAGTLMTSLGPDSFGPSMEVDLWRTAIAGFITGFGTRLGGGCTSGHGVCGLPRRSPRSLVAVLTFMATGSLSAKIFRDIRFSDSIPSSLGGFSLPVLLCLGAGSGMVLSHQRRNSPSPSLLENLSSYLSGLLFGVGLTISGMTNPLRVTGFLDFSRPEGWDPTLMGVMGGAVLFNLFSFQALHVSETPALLTSSQAPALSCAPMGLKGRNLEVDWKLVLGSALFGIGWGMGGICPGPGLVSFASPLASFFKDPSQLSQSLGSFTFPGAASLTLLPAMALGILAHNALFSPSTPRPTPSLSSKKAN